VVVVLAATTAVKWVYGALAAGIDVSQVYVWAESKSAGAEESADWRVATRALVTWRMEMLAGELRSEALRDFAKGARSWESLEEERAAACGSTWVWVEEGNVFPRKVPAGDAWWTLSADGSFSTRMEWNARAPRMVQAAAAPGLEQLERAAGVRQGCSARGCVSVDTAVVGAEAVQRAQERMLGAGVHGGAAAEVWRAWALHAKLGISDGQAPAPPRHGGMTDPEDNGFRHWGRYLTGEWAPSVCVAGRQGQQQPVAGVERVLTREQSLLRHGKVVQGKTFYGFLPRSLVKAGGIGRLYRAWRRAPLSTRGTILVPFEPDSPELQEWVGGTFPKWDTVRYFAKGKKILSWTGRDGQVRNMVEGIPHAYTMLRLGSARYGDSPFRARKQRPDAAAEERAWSRQAEEAVAAELDRTEAAAAREAWQSYGAAEQEPEGVAEEWGDVKKAAFEGLMRTEYGRRWRENQPERVQQWQRGELPKDGDDAANWFTASAGRPPGAPPARIHADVLQSWVGRVSEAEREAVQAAADCAKNDVDLELKHQKVEWFEVPNRPSCAKYADRIKAEVEFYEKSGAWRRCTRADVDGLNPLLVAVGTVSG
jgi:hypothetical protein